MKRHYLPFALLLMTGCTVMPAPDWQQPAWVQRGDFCEPETVLPMPDGTLLVSNVCDFRASGTGFLTRLAADGRVLDWRAVEGLDSPLGMAIWRDQLLVVDSNRVRRLSRDGLAELELIELPTRVANDIAVAADGTIYVTDTALGQVFEVAPDGTPAPIASGATFPGANGIAIDGRTLWVGGERLWRVDLDSGRQATFGPGWITDIDGIEIETDGTLQITPVDGPLIRLTAEGALLDVTGVEGAGSANHGFDPRTRLVLIPTGFDNRVVAFPLPE